MADLDAANAAARAWCAEVNGQVHSEIAAVPAERLVSEREVLRPLPSRSSTVARGQTRARWINAAACASARRRYLVPKTLVGESVEVLAHEDKVVIHHAGVEVIRHDPVGPGEVAFGDLADPIGDPTRGIRPRTAAEVAFLGLGPAAETFLRTAAAAGTLRLEHELAAIVELVAVWGREAVTARWSAPRVPAFQGRRRARHPGGRAGSAEARCCAGQQLVLDLPAGPRCVR